MPAHSFIPLRDTLRRARPVDSLAFRLSVTGKENPEGEFVLYRARSARRLRSNPALEHAIALANRAGVAVVVFESLQPDGEAANDRIHSFVLEGVAANAADAAARGLGYVFLPPEQSSSARTAFASLAARARLIVTDEYPAFLVREQTVELLADSPVAVHLVDANGILPMRIFEKEQFSAKFLRDRAHRFLPDYWPRFEEQEVGVPFRGALDVPHYDGSLPREAASRCAIDHTIAPVRARGGRSAALDRLAAFVREGLPGYAEGRNRSMRHLSGLSPYLHFGFVGIHEVAERALFSDAPDEDIDAFLEESIIRRELSFNMCFYNEHYASLEALPKWAGETLARHRGDRRKPLYACEELEAAATHDQVWNLAQRQLLVSGTIHGYLRMLWGKKIIEWSESPEEAHRTMMRLHDRFAIDGRDPNTCAGILWCFGKHDRPWAPERPIFGTIRWMSSDQTAKKVRLAEIEASIQRDGQQILS